MTDYRAELAIVLKVAPKHLDRRIAALKIGPVCRRCGGSGSYSFNAMDGSRCYGCGGFGYVAPKEADLPAVLASAQAAALDGRVDAHIAYLRSKAALENGMTRIMAAWNEVPASALYSRVWRRASEAPTVTSVNKRCAKAHENADRARQLVWKLQHAWQSDEYKAAVIAFSVAVEDALREIADAATVTEFPPHELAMAA